MGFLKQKSLNNMLLKKIHKLDAIFELHESKAKDLQSQINVLATGVKTHNGLLLEDTKKYKLTHIVLVKLNAKLQFLEKKFDDVCDLFTGGKGELPAELQETSKEVETMLMEEDRVVSKEFSKSISGAIVTSLNKQKYILCSQCATVQYFFVNPEVKPPLCNNCGTHQGEIKV